jgi:hypothetical protein
MGASSSDVAAKLNLVTVLKPDGTQLVTGTFSSGGASYDFDATCSGQVSGTTSLNLGTLPLTGTYQILLQQTHQLLPQNAGTVTTATLNFSGTQ